MFLFKALSYILLFVTVLSAPPQKNMAYDTHLRIPNILLDGRKNCGVETFLSDQKGLFSCDVVLPIGTDTWDKYIATLCFGMYDTLYELCKYQNLTFDVPRYQANQFCEKANKSLDNYNFVHGNAVFGEWVPQLRLGLGVLTNCTLNCIHGSERFAVVNPACSVIVAALERIPVAMAATSQSKSSSVTQSLDVKSSTLSGFQKKPSTPTKGSDPVSANVKTPVPAQPVAAVPAKTEDVQKSPSADSTPPPAEAVRTPGQVVKPVSKLPAEPKLENPELENPGDIGPIEDEDGPLLESQQPDTPAEQSPDLIPPRGVPSGSKFPEEESQGKQENVMPNLDEQPYLSIPKDDSEETNMVTYFVLMTVGALLIYIAFHNKNKLLALALEGRRSGRRGGRHSSAAYSKLHSNLEETISAGPTSPSATHVLY